MAIRSLDPEQRQDYFERISRTLGAERAEILIAGVDIGAQTEAEDAHLTGLAYDPRSDEIGIYTDVAEHRIAHPREVYVDDSVEGLHSLEIVDADGNKRILRLKQPLRLSGPGVA